MANPFTIPAISEQYLAGKFTDARLATIIDILLGLASSSQNPTPPNAIPATIAGGGNWNSGVMPANGNSFAASAELDQAGTLTLQRYIDAAGTIPIGNSIQQVMSANTLATVAANDEMPCASWNVVIANTSGTLGNLTDVVLLEKK